MKYMKTPVQVQLFITSGCNRSCPWCIEKENMASIKDAPTAQYIESIDHVLSRLKYDGVPFNVVITGGEPAIDKERLYSVIDSIRIPKVEPVVSTDGRNTQAYKVGINTNGDIKLDNLRLKNITYIDATYNEEFTVNPHEYSVPVRLQSCYRKEWYRDDQVVLDTIIGAAERGYSDILFRETVHHFDSPDIFELMRRLTTAKIWKMIDYQFNVYDTWVKWELQGFKIYFKKQNLELQKLWEELNKDNVCSLVVWPDALITKSWDRTNIW